MATIMVELQWSQRKGRNWSFCRFTKCQEQSSYIFQAVESYKIFWATKQGKYCYRHFTYGEADSGDEDQGGLFIKNLLLGY